MTTDDSALAAREQLALEMRAAMRRTAAGVAIVTTVLEHRRAGITVSSFGPLSLDPPSVLACMSTDSRTLAAILASGMFAANVLAHDQSDLAEQFADPAAKDSRFHTGAWTTLVTGAPVLQGSVSTFDCRLATSFVFGSHRIIVGEIQAVRTTDAAPMVYHARAYGRFGLLD